MLCTVNRIRLSGKLLFPETIGQPFRIGLDIFFASKNQLQLKKRCLGVYTSTNHENDWQAQR